MSDSNFFAKYHTRFYFLIRYGISGVIAALIPIVFLFVWVSVLGHADTYLLGVVFGFIFALVFAFILQKYWAFRDVESSRAPRQLLWYSAVALSGLALNALLLMGAKSLFELFRVDFFHGWYLVAQAVSIAIVAVYNFSMNFLFTFRDARENHLWDQ